MIEAWTHRDYLKWLRRERGKRPALRCDEVSDEEVCRIVRAVPRHYTTVYSTSYSGSATYGTASDSGFPAGLNGWTISGWFKTTVVGESGSIERFCLSYGIATAHHRATMCIYNLGGAGTKLTDDNAATALQGTTVLSANTWYHGAIVSTVTQVLIYLNGTLENTITTTESPTLGGTCSVGTPFDNLGNASYTWNGLLFEMAVFPSSLSGANIASMAAGTTDPSSYSPVSFWKGTEGMGTTVADVSGNSNTLNLVGGVGWSTDVPPPFVTSGVFLPPTKIFQAVKRASFF